MFNPKIFFEKVQEPFAWTKEHVLLENALLENKWENAQDIYDRIFYQKDKFFKFPRLVEALKTSLIGVFAHYQNEGVLISDYFERVQRLFFNNNEDEFKKFCSGPELKDLFIEFVKFNLKKADYHGIYFAAKFFDKYLENNSKILEDREIQRIISESIFLNLIESECPYFNNVEKISNTFLIGREKELIRLAVAARALLMDRANGNDLKNAKMIESRFLKVTIGPAKDESFDDDSEVEVA